MRTSSHISRRSLLAAGAALTLARPAQAQSNYPSRPIRIVVPFAAGGGQDITARLLADPLRAALGQTIVVENRGGAGGMIGAQAVAAAQGDGYTILLGGAGETAIAQHLHRQMAYDPVRDLKPVSLVAKVPNVLMGSMSAPFKTVGELVEYARAHPGELSYSSSGTGNLQHLTGEMLNRMAGIETVHVPYRGSAPAVTDIAAGLVQFGFNSLASGLSLIRDGRIRALAVTSRERLPDLPDVPPVSDYPPLAEFELINWFGVFAPGTTPDPIVQRLSAAIATALQDAELRRKFVEQGLLPQSMTPAEYLRFVTGESEKLGRIVREANVTVDG
jgi:tripartite-type tricarboxylate transporter receptor subunit TctC